MERPLALVMDGGGARSAFQVGVLRGLARELGDFHPSILTGVSAGAINVSFLANHTGTCTQKVEELHALWSRLDTQSVFVASGGALFWRAARAGLKLAFGWPPARRTVQGMVDTSPLRETLMRGLGTRDGVLHGVAENLASGRLRAVALLATRYATGQTVSFCQGADFQDWERPKRGSLRTELSVDQVMASSSLPLLFPAVRVDGDWYGDGGIRLVAPLAPAVHLGARRILAISTRYASTSEEVERRTFEGPPSPAQIAGNLFGAIFLDQLEQDALNLQRINCLLDGREAAQCEDLAPIDLEILRPPRDLGVLANEFEPDLPFVFRHLTRNLGTRQAKSQDLLSTVMFVRPYIHALLDLGEAEGRRAAPRVAELLGGGARD